MARKPTLAHTTALAGTCLLALGAASRGHADDARLTQGDDPYFKQAQAALQENLELQNNTNRAKNVILANRY
jgi:hypothetical protein